MNAVQQKPDLRVLTDDGRLLVIRWTPEGARCDAKVMVSQETRRRIEEAMRREWLLPDEGRRR